MVVIDGDHRSVRVHSGAIALVRALLRPFFPALMLTAIASSASGSASSVLTATIDEAAQAAIEAGESPGLQVAVFKNGAPVLVKGYGSANLELKVPVDNDSVFRIGSITKQFAAAALLKLQEEGKLSINDRLSKYYPRYPRAADITLAQMLHHTSGLHSYTDDADLMEREGALRLTTDQWVERFARMPKTQDFEPGASWHYSDTAYFLLGGVIEKVAGKPLATVFEERFFKPLGLSHTALDDEQRIVPGRAAGYDGEGLGQFKNAGMLSMTFAGAAGAMRSSATDLAKWNAALFGGSVLEPASLHALITPGRLNNGELSGTAMTGNDGSQLSEYGYGLRLSKVEGHTRIGHGGGIPGFSSSLQEFPDDQLTVAVLTNSIGKEVGVAKIARSIERIALGLPAQEAAAVHAAEVPTYDYDLVIRNGRVLDGQGNPWVRADVAIKDGRFARIGHVPGRGRREIDASNDYVSPGWIDMMDQSGEVLLRNGLAENKLRQGITTAIAGEGGTPVPSARVADYLSQLETQGISINFGTYYGTGQARADVMGDVAGKPKPAQMEKMKAHVAAAMRGGALGIASALIYPPDSFQSTEDLIELARVAAQYDGIYATHMRDESAKLLEAIRETIEIGEQSGIQVEIFHFKGAYAPGWGKLVPEGGRLIEAARARGVNIAADMYLYPAGGTGLEITVPTWVFEQGVEQGVRRLKDPKIRERLKKEVAAGSQPGWSNLVEAAGGWQGVVLANPYNERYDRYRNRSLEYIGKELGKHPADVAWDIMLEALPNRAFALFFVMSEPDIETALKFPWMSIGSDAGAAERPGEMDALGLPHPRAYGNAVRVIAEYVKKRHVITLEDAVRKLTSWPATRMRLYDRGAIREGLKADVTIFNYERLDDVASFENPMGFPTGIDYVLVNGQLVIDRGRHTGAKPGSVLRGAGYRLQR